MRLLPLCLPILITIAGCAGHPKPAKVSEAQGPQAAIVEQQQMIDTSARAHADVLAPEEMDGAREVLEEARQKLAKGKDDKAVYEAVGISRTYVAQANRKTEARTAANQEILTAREKALAVGAAETGAIKGVDKKFREHTLEDDDYKKMTSGHREDLRHRYLGAELAAIKHRKLGEVERTLADARTKGAMTLVPQAYNEAKAKHRKAELAIEANRHAEDRYAAAAVAANNALSLTETALTTQKMTPEQRAQIMQERNRALQEADSLNAQYIEESMAKEDALAAQAAAMGAMTSQNEQMRRRQKADQAVRDAAKQFDPSEAEVYRQDENLVIRLKKVNFATGRSDLPAQALPLLEKVKTVMSELNPEAVTIEGHTDSVGSATVNQKLSEERADAVAKYLESDSSFEETKFDTAGYGYSKPLTSNKGSEDRAVNRRVDVVITPGTSL